jgi:cytochrome c553
VQLTTIRLGLFGAALAAALLGAAPLPAAADAAQIANSVCIGCHGMGGISYDPNYPRLAGQQPTYVVKQLTEFMAGKRANPEMLPFLQPISPSEFAGLGAYFAAQKPLPPKPAKDAALAAAGKKLFEEGNLASGLPACVGCHQAGALGNEKYPRLAGQHAAYILKQIRGFKAGVRTNDKAREMRGVAEKITEQEMAAAAEYLSSL